MKQRRMNYKTAEKWFNRFIRLRDCDENGYAKCCACGTIGHYKSMQAGHFIHGLDFIEKNQHIQCVKCNYFGHGVLDKYAEFMVKKYGQEEIDRLRLYKNMNNNPKGYAVDLIGQEYKRKAKELSKEKGLPV